MEQPRSTLAAGMQVTPNVRLISKLGSGGMGAVWLAHHDALNTRVVVKFMLVALDSSSSARLRFKREAEAASQVKSPHVVQTFDYGLTAEGVPFIVMEYLEGRDLGQEIASKGALDPASVVTVITQVAKALAKAHGAGLLHRDIKPDNIFLCQSESEDEMFVKLLDFGIAKRPMDDETSELDSQTRTGQVVGTPFYMSPEQVTAQKVIDLRSDLWSLGIVAFEALTGKRPFDGPSFGALAVKIATTDAPRPSDSNPALPPSVDAWFAQACAREPSARFATARELADKLRAAFEGVVSLPLISGVSDLGPRPRLSSGNDLPAASKGPISVDDDAHDRPSFALASTAQEATPAVRTPETSASDSSALARSEPGRMTRVSSESGASNAVASSSSTRVLLPAIAVAVVTLAIAVGWKAKEHTGGGGSEGADTSALTTPLGATSKQAGAPALRPSSLLPSATPPLADGAAPPASHASDTRGAPTTTAIAAAQPGNAQTLPGGRRPAVPPSSAPGTSTTTPSASSPSSPRPTATSHDDPLF